MRLREFVGRDRGEQGEALNAVYGRIAAQHDHTMPKETFGQRLPVAMPSSPGDGFGIIMHIGGGGVEARDLRSPWQLKIAHFSRKIASGSAVFFA